jgi:chromosome segregation ATPase
MSYLSRISASKEEKEKGSFARAAKAAAQQLDVDILTIENRIADTENKVDEAKGQVPFNANTVITLQRTLKNLQEDLADLKSLKETEFSA